MDEMFNNRATYVVDNLKELATLTANENGAQRFAWTPTWEKARVWFKEKATPWCSEITTDAAGNIWAKLQGESNEAIVTGSHLDSVPNGGPLDGALGVVAGLEVLRYYAENKITPKKTIYVVNWADEEGARYGYSCLGSSAATGTFEVKDFIGRKDAKGILFADAISDFGLSLDTFLDANKTFKEKIKDIKAYVELHIEQGPILEQTGKDVASVYGATGVERYYIDFIGQAAHAGSFPTEMRRDAFLAAATAALEFRNLALEYNAVCTVGEVHVEPDVVTIIPGKCTISLDIRTINKEDLQIMLQKAQQIATNAAKQFECETAWRKIYAVAPQLFDEKLVEICKQAVQEETGEATNMYSGPLHDAVEMSKCVPTVMMFVMSQGGISHAKEEYTPEKNLRAGIRAYLRLMQKLINE